MRNNQFQNVNKIINFVILLRMLRNKVTNHNAKPTTMEIINSLKGKDKVKVLFVCLGNICRSPAGEGILRAIVEENGAEADWEIDSAGLYGGHAGEMPDRRMRIHARRRGLELTHRSRKVTPRDLSYYDIILGMDDSNLSRLRDMSDSIETDAKIVPMISFVKNLATRYDHIPDPYYDGEEGFELVLDLLEEGCRNLFEAITQQRTKRS